MPETTVLEWKGAPGNIIAQGKRGMYSIQSLSGGVYALQAIEGEARAELGIFGKIHHTLDAAKTAAQEVDNV